MGLASGKGDDVVTCHLGAPASPVCAATGRGNPGWVHFGIAVCCRFGILRVGGAGKRYQDLGGHIINQPRLVHVGLATRVGDAAKDLVRSNELALGEPCNASSHF